MLQQIRRQLMQCVGYISRTLYLKGSFEIGCLNTLCDLLLSQQVLSEQQQLKAASKSIMNNNVSISKVGSNKNTNNNTKTVVDFPLLISQLLAIPLPQKSIQPKHQQSQHQFLQLMIVDSLIFNLYARSKKVDTLKLNNSFFNSSTLSMSMSQLSDNYSEHNINNNFNINDNTDMQLKQLTLMYLESTVYSELFYKRLKLFYDRQANRQRNHHYLQNLLQTVEYILSKEKLSAVREHFVKMKNMYFKTFMKSPSVKQITFVPSQDNLLKVNSVIFGDQLDKIITLISYVEEEGQKLSFNDVELSELPNGNNYLNINKNARNKPTNNSNANRVLESLLFSLNRIYFTCRKQHNHQSQQSSRRHFRSISNPSQDIFYNLTRHYIKSFSSKLSILQESRHPIFLLLKSYLIVFHLPVFKKFNKIVMELTGCYREEKGVVLFYEENFDLIERLLCGFVEELPVELVEFLAMLYRVVEGCYCGSVGGKGGINTNKPNSKANRHSHTQSSASVNSINNKNNNSAQKNKNTSISSMIPIKRFLIYSFFCDPELVKQFVYSHYKSVNGNVTHTNSKHSSSHSDQKKSHTNIINSYTNNSPTNITTTTRLQHFEQVCNLIINLFFTTSVKKYTNIYTVQQLAPLINLSHVIQHSLQQKIVKFDYFTQYGYYERNDDQQEELAIIPPREGYFVEQPVLNYDYWVVNGMLEQVEFTPKDSRRYDIKSYLQVYTNNQNPLQKQPQGYNQQDMFVKPNHNTNTNLANTNRHQSRQLTLIPNQIYPNILNSKLSPIHHNKNKKDTTNMMSYKLITQSQLQQEQLLGVNYHYHHHQQQQTVLGAKMMSKSKTGHSFFNNNQSQKSQKLYHTDQSPLIIEPRSMQLNNPNHNKSNNNNKDYYEGVDYASLLLQETSSEDVDLLTWMTIGGSHDYSQKVSARKQRLKRTQELLQVQHQDIKLQGEPLQQHQHRIIKQSSGLLRSADDQQKQKQQQYNEQDGEDGGEYEDEGFQDQQQQDQQLVQLQQLRQQQTGTNTNNIDSNASGNNNTSNNNTSNNKTKPIYSQGNNNFSIEQNAATTTIPNPFSLHQNKPHRIIRNNNQQKKLLQFKTFDRAKIKEINQLYYEYEAKNIDILK